MVENALIVSKNNKSIIIDINEINLISEIRISSSISLIRQIDNTNVGNIINTTILISVNPNQSNIDVTSCNVSTLSVPSINPTVNRIENKKLIKMMINAIIDINRNFTLNLIFI